ncbi:MAG: Uma2 family endonuclease [Gammaproteobacteria bacterium]
MGKAEIFQPGARVELIDGEVIDRVPIGSRHAGIVKRLIRDFTRAAGDVAIVSAQVPVILGIHSEPLPDLALLRPRDDFYSAHPQPADVFLIVEVADTTLRYDRDVKVPSMPGTISPKCGSSTSSTVTPCLLRACRGEISEG